MARTSMGRYVAAGAGVLVLALAAVIAVARLQDDRPRRAGTESPGLPGCAPDPSRPARAPLTDLARGVAALADDVPAGRYTYVRARSWSIETATETGLPEIANRDEQLWWAADRSGRRQVTVLPPVPLVDLPAAQAAGPVLVDNYGPGDLALVVDRPSSDPALLAAQLAEHEPPSNGRHAAVRSVADMYRYHALSPAQRAAALLVLANTDGLTACGEATDRLGRTGLVISADSDNGATRHVLSVDPRRGSVLGYEHVAVVNPPQSTLRTPGVTSQVLFLASGRTNSQSSATQSPNPSSRMRTS